MGVITTDNPKGAGRNQCNRCLKIKDLSLFYNDSSKKNGKKGICKECLAVTFKSHNTKKREYYQENKVRILEKLKLQRKDNHGSSRKYVLKNQYGITPEVYDILLELQNSVCAICGNISNNGNFLSVDHNHNTGKVRGLLCQKCNTAIGLLREDIELIKKAYNYLYEE